MFISKKAKYPMRTVSLRKNCENCLYEYYVYVNKNSEAIRPFCKKHNDFCGNINPDWTCKEFFLYTKPRSINDKILNKEIKKSKRSWLNITRK